MFLGGLGLPQAQKKPKPLNDGPRGPFSWKNWDVQIVQGRTLKREISLYDAPGARSVGKNGTFSDVS